VALNYDLTFYDLYDVSFAKKNRLIQEGGKMNKNKSKIKLVYLDTGSE
jgi:hypothetical protein